jgi:hypothetical protein
MIPNTHFPQMKLIPTAAIVFTIASLFGCSNRDRVGDRPVNRVSIDVNYNPKLFSRDHAPTRNVIDH